LTTKLYVGDLSSDQIKTLKGKIPFLSKNLTAISHVEDHLVLEGATHDVLKQAEHLRNEVSSSLTGAKPNKIFEYIPKSLNNNSEIYQELIDREWIVHFGDGLIGFGREFREAVQKLDQLILSWANALRADDYVYPDLISVETLHRCNYIKQFPSQLMFASHVIHDLDKIHGLSECGDEGNPSRISAFMEESQYAVKPTLCMHVYEQFKNRNLNEPRVITTLGKCKRYEPINAQKVERLLDFSMREIVFLGPASYVLQKREELMALVSEYITKLDLHANIQTGMDPFFTTAYSQKALLQKRFKMKYELEAYLPYNQSFISVASFNYHETYFSNIFNITNHDGDKLHTGCVGFGLERFIYAYLSQMGLTNPQVNRLGGE